MSRRRWTWKDTVIEWIEGAVIYLGYGLAAFAVAFVVIYITMHLLGG